MRADPRGWLAGLVLWLAAPAALATLEAGSEPARRFGYTLGDVVQQTLHLRLAPGQVLLEESLPATGRASRWFSRRSIVATAEPGGWKIALDYQLINAPASVDSLALPALRLQLRDGTRQLEAHYAETPLSAAALIPGGAAVGGGGMTLRPDLPPPLLDTAPRRQRLVAYGLAAGLLALYWAAWHYGVGLRGRRARPFAAAERELRRRLRHDVSPEACREAMRRLHRAFDASAGATLVGATFDRLFVAQPALLPARAAVAEFFAASDAEFFGAGAPAAGCDAGRLLALARQLKVLERSAADA